MNTHRASLAASYALNRHVPAMDAGFSITTGYGELWINAEEIHREPCIVRAVERILHRRLKAAERGQEAQP